MAEMTIRLQLDPVTGKKDIIVSLRSDDDALPHEHEQQHKQLVDKLIEGGALSADQVGKLIVERQEESSLPQSVPEQSNEERSSHSQGN